MPRRLSVAVVCSAILALALLAGALGCGGERAEREALRQELLAPKAPSAQPEAPRRELLVGADGELLASEEQVAGLSLPRGLEPGKKREEYAWHFSTQRASLEQLDRYFAAQLFTAEIDRRSTGLVRYVGAQLLNAPQAPRVTVEITPMPKLANTVYVDIVQIARGAERKPVPSEAQVRAQLEAQRKFAD